MQLLICGWNNYGKECLEYILCQLERISSVLMLGKMAMSVPDQDRSLIIFMWIFLVNLIKEIKKIKHPMSFKQECFSKETLL